MYNIYKAFYQQTKKQAWACFLTAARINVIRVAFYLQTH